MMRVNRIAATNFRSFADLDVRLGDLTVLIGANAAGKSNFVELFRFLRNIARHGLEDAVSMQGGAGYLTNLQIGPDQPVTVHITCDRGVRLAIKKGDQFIGAEVQKFAYQFVIAFADGGVRVLQDEITRDYRFCRLERIDDGYEERESIGTGRVSVLNADGELQVTMRALEGAPDVSLEDLVFYLPRREERRILIPASNLLLQTPFFQVEPFESHPLDTLAVYDFDPTLPRRSVPITGRTELEENGSNLAIALRSILDDPEKAKQLTNLVQDILPFVDELQTENLSDKSLFFAVRENYYAKSFLPASLLSDGTIAVTCLMIALHFQGKRLAIFEEPERNVHPSLIHKLVDMMEEVSHRSQILVTTHNPQVVQHAPLESLLLISRGKDGFSVVSRPADREDVKVFLENEIGVEDLFAQGLLEG